MNSRERVIAVIKHERFDRIPIYGWVRANLEEVINKTFGSVKTFEDRYEFDWAHLSGGPSVYPLSTIEELKSTALKLGKVIHPADVLDLPFTDPDDEESYQSLIQEIQFYKENRQRFILVQVPGCFEFYNDLFGLEHQLMYLLEYPEELKELYQRLLKWSIQLSMNCIDLGVDMIHVSDDWGSQKGLLFNKSIWWDLIFPYHKKLVDMVKRRKVFVSLHSDGNINDIVEGIVEIGYQVVHPWQESAGMSLKEQKEKYSDKFVVMGGLDVQTVLGFKDYFKVQLEIDRVLNLFKDGGLLFCTTHFVQPHCEMEELCFAYDYLYHRVRELAEENMNFLAP